MFVPIRYLRAEPTHLNTRQRFLLSRELEKTAAETYRQVSKSQEWDHYLSCKKIPDPANPADLRDFLYQWNYELEQQKKNFVSWTLDVNERTWLTQDDTDPNKTWQCLFDENKDVGSSLLPGIRNALHILALIEDSALKSFSQKEVVKVRDEIRVKIAQVLDEITMRVGGNIWRDMIPIDPIRAEFMFTSDIINFYLWSFQHVPLPPEYNYLVKVIEMKSLSIKFQKPPSFDLKNCSMRGMWTQFDHFSDLDPSFRCPISEPIPDLIASQEMEWADRNLLRAQKLQEMKSAREHYEVEQKKKELEELEAAKGGKKPTKKKKKSKSKDKAEVKPLEAPPPVITENTTVDIDDLYVLQEQQNYERKMEQIGPNSLNVGTNYINLRQHVINGGIFSIQRFEKLPQPSELRGDFIYTTFSDDLKLTENKFTCESDIDLIVLNIKLPEQYFWWHSPVVCFWEDWTESTEFSSLSEELQNFHLNFDNIMEEKSKQLFSAPKQQKQMLKPTIISDFPITDIPMDVKIHFLIKDHILPRLPQRFKFYAEMHKQFSIIQGLFVRDQRLKIEEKLNDLLNVTFQKMKAAGQSIEEYEQIFRVPSLSDIPAGKESMASLDGSLVSSEIQTPVTSMLEELVEAQYAPAYLFPPCRKIPFLIIAEKQQSEPSDLELDGMMQDILESVLSDDDFSSEAVYKLFSTFIKFLDRLRELEQPVFPDVIEQEEPEADTEVALRNKSRVISRDSKHHHSSWTDIRGTRTSRRLSSFSVTGAPRPQSRNSVKLARKKRKRRKSTIEACASDASTDEEREPKEVDPMELKKIAHPPGRWTTGSIHKQEYDPDCRTVTIWTEKLGTFGFAMRRYYNLPFRGWDMRRIGKLSDLTTCLTLDCVGLQFSINVTKSGYTVKFGAAPQDITAPTKELSLEELAKYLTKVNLNIFPDVDAPFYVTEMTTPKHESMEIHTLKCMAAFCLTHNFTNCFWNKYAPFREALFQSRQVIEGCPEQTFGTVMVNPLKAAVVTVEELCSPLDEVILGYHPTPENQADAHDSNVLFSS
ncbi:AAEL005595-PA [Aedes aegypti]|uniref:AAEL005595-PA n=1 Tax=Aedes aegypti TaxID=7159 RepID=Q179I2_AEDAE|nr:AAEL005595-PA [Aedes aegypti]